MTATTYTRDTMVEEQTKDLQDYLTVIKKRKKGIQVVAISIMLITVLVAFLLPLKYKSSATILIEQQEIPQELVMSTVTSYAAERIQTIQARVMSRANLLQIIDKYKLYVDERRYETTEEINLRMQEDVGLDIISADVVDPRTGRPSSATIAFSLSYTGEDPEAVQKVANELTTLYLNENLKNRTQKAEDTSVFFDQESTKLGNTISELEQKLALFKQENADMLPELQVVNQQILQRKELELSAIEARITSLEEKKYFAEGQLAQIDPGNPNIPSAETRLKVLEAEYAAARSRYSEDHPDVQNMKREIDSLRASSGQTGSQDEIASSLSKMRNELLQLVKKYSPEHPDVINMEQSIKTLEQQLNARNELPESAYYRGQPDNPAYITLRAQLASVASEVRSAKEQKQNLLNDIRSTEESMLKAPLVEREYRTLTRDYENAVALYQETKIKQSRADVARQLESDNKGERFTLIDPAALPEDPVSPNRPAILLLGLLFSLGSGIGFAFVSDVISGAIHGAKNIQAVLGMAPLAIIPYEMNMSDVKKRTRIQKRTILIGIVSIIAGGLLVHFFISPIDVLWFRVLRKYEILTS